MNRALKNQLSLAACKIRQGVIEGTFHAKSGHPGGSLSIADLLAYLYFVELNVNPENPAGKNRDRLVLSKGHAAPALYAALAHKGFFSPDELKTLRSINSRLQGHPNMNDTPGVDMSTGSLGQGISTAVGMALAAKKTGASYRAYAILGDGELQEGQVWEAAMFAGHNKLDNLVAIIDSNDLQIDGRVSEICSVCPIADKFEAFGWHTFEMDGHDFEQMEEVFAAARLVKDKPVAIVMTTIKGKGVSFMEDVGAWHGSAPNAEQYEKAMNELLEVQKGLEVQSNG